MELEEGKQKFIESWGQLGSNWGISKTMAKVHALLLISHHPLNEDSIINALQISRGNSNTNLRALLDWGLIHKTCKDDCRKDYYTAEKDLWIVCQKIILHRKKKELDPMIQVLEELSDVQNNCEASDEFCKVVKDLKVFSTKADKSLSNLMNAESNWFTNAFIKMIR
jgi:DNA-binding transcriptional regulator GbsR (MarR family)